MGKSAAHLARRYDPADRPPTSMSDLTAFTVGATSGRIG